jgi:hypothetical protein
MAEMAARASRGHEYMRRLSRTAADTRYIPPIPSGADNDED